jgi:hypothetical protein
VAVRNLGTAVESNLSVTVVSPSQATLVEAVDGNGIGGCVPGTDPVTGLATFTSTVSSLAAGKAPASTSCCGATAPLPPIPHHPYGRVIVQAVNQPDAYPDDNQVDFSGARSPTVNSADSAGRCSRSKRRTQPWNVSGLVSNSLATCATGRLDSTAGRTTRRC